MKIFIYSAHHFEKPFLEKAAQGKYELIYTAYALDTNTVELAKGYTTISLFTTDDASTKVVEKLYEYGVCNIVLRCVGHNNIDIDSAKSLGMKVSNVPAYSPFAVAEHAVALLLALNRKIVLGQKLIKKNNFSLDQLIGFDLHGKTVGIVGTGEIGSVFTNIMKGFGCNLLGYDIVQNQKLVAQTNITYCSLEKLCQQSDIISIHCPLNDTTKYLFDRSTFLMMKKGVYIINTARGGVINTKDLIDAIDNKIIAGIGLDVYENERDIFFRNHLNNVIIDETFNKLRAYPNVLITGHQAFLTQEALTRIAETIFDTINQWESSGKSKNDL